MSSTETSDKETLKKQLKKEKANKKSAENMALLEQKIEEINNKLCEMLTKKDKQFIKEILVDTLDEMREKIIGTVMKKVNQLEGEVHEIALEKEKQEKEMKKLSEKNEDLVEKNKKLVDRISKEEEKRKYDINDLEQYGRRNNVRVSGLDFDNKYESSQQTAEGIATLLNNQMGMNISSYDIDIAHRLGKYEDTKIRNVIVKFVQRQVKVTVMKNTKKLKGTTISINEDLTKINLEVLASLRLKGKDTIDKSWSYEGKLYAQMKNGKIQQVTSEDYSKWLALKWPKETE